MKRTLKTVGMYAFVILLILAFAFMTVAGVGIQQKPIP